MNTSCDRARRKARWLRYAITSVMVVIVVVDLLLAWRWLAHRPGDFGFLHAGAPSQLDSHPRLMLIACATLSLIYIYGLHRLVRLMRLFELGEFFSLDATRHLRAFALSLLSGTIAGCLLPPIELVLARLAGLNHIHAVTIRMDDSDVWMILISSLFFVITWIMGEARQLAEDNQLIV